MKYLVILRSIACFFLGAFTITLVQHTPGDTHRVSPPFTWKDPSSPSPNLNNFYSSDTLPSKKLQNTPPNDDPPPTTTFTHRTTTFNTPITTSTPAAPAPTEPPPTFSPSQFSAFRSVPYGPPKFPESMYPSLPLVSVVIPTTRERAEYHYRIIQCFLNQTYPKLELRLYETSENEEHKPSDLIRTLAQLHPNIHYTFEVKATRVGSKRNFLAKASEGEFIVHFDDDDYYGPHYVETMIYYTLLYQTDMIKLSGWFIISEAQTYFGYKDADVSLSTDANFVLDSKKGHLNRAGTTGTFARDDALGYGLSMVYAKKIFRDVEFNETVRWGSDWTFVVNAMEMGYTLSLIDDVWGIMCVFKTRSFQTSVQWAQYYFPWYLTHLIFGHDPLFWSYVYKKFPDVFIRTEYTASGLNVRMLAYDGNLATRFQSAEKQTPKKNFCLFFGIPKFIRGIRVYTGTSKNVSNYAIHEGYLEVNEDPDRERVGDFVNGQANVKLNRTIVVKNLCIQITADYFEPLSIREIELDEVEGVLDLDRRDEKERKRWVGREKGGKKKKEVKIGSGVTKPTDGLTPSLDEFKKAHLENERKEKEKEKKEKERKLAGKKTTTADKKTTTDKIETETETINRG